jgi:predicted nucleotidyltransferase
VYGARARRVQAAAGARSGTARGVLYTAGVDAGPGKDSAAEIEAKLRQFLTASAGAEGLAAAYLFGSVARRSATRSSDVDVAVLYAEAPPPGLAGLASHLEAELERLLGLPVQVVVLNRAPVDLVQRVLRDGRLLLDRDPSRRIRFEVRTRQEFWDLEPILKRYRRGAGERPR